MIKTITVPANKIEVGHIVDNRNSLSPLIVTSVKGFTHFGNNTYTIEVSRDDSVVFEVELGEQNVLTYTYEIAGA